jgi:multidrug transporter EmrE-like cation transporter
MKLGLVYLIINIISSTLSQLILKWQVNVLNFKFESFINFFNFIFSPWVILTIILFGVASISWVLVLSQYDISFIYPFSLLSFVLIFIFGVILFNEPITIKKIMSLLLIITGLYFFHKSN